jgi:hypothetical protein
MKPMPSVALATWMLEHVTFGSPNESLSGDLLEEFQSGRTAGWYWRQALAAIAITLSDREDKRKELLCLRRGEYFQAAGDDGFRIRLQLCDYPSSRFWLLAWSERV